MKFNSRFFTSNRENPVISELRHDVANRDTEVKRLEKKIALLTSRNEELECRLARIRQCAFGILDLPEIKGGP